MEEEDYFGSLYLDEVNDFEDEFTRITYQLFTAICRRNVSAVTWFIEKYPEQIGAHKNSIDNSTPLDSALYSYLLYKGSKKRKEKQTDIEGEKASLAIACLLIKNGALCNHKRIEYYSSHYFKKDRSIPSEKLINKIKKSKEYKLLN